MPSTGSERVGAKRERARTGVRLLDTGLAFFRTGFRLEHNTAPTTNEVKDVNRLTLNIVP